MTNSNLNVNGGILIYLICQDKTVEWLIWLGNDTSDFFKLSLLT